MPKYVLDTSLYIRAARDDAWRDELEGFSASYFPFLYMHSVVAGELLAGAVQPDLEKRTQQHLISPFEATGRVITASHASWKRAGQAIAHLVRKRSLSATGVGRSFMNDCLIAASAREHGFTLITENARDFGRIRTVSPFEFVAPWPQRPRS